MNTKQLPSRSGQGSESPGGRSDSAILSIVFFLISGVSLLVAVGTAVRLFAFLVALKDFGQSLAYVLETNPGVLLWDFIFIWVGLLGFILFGVLGIVMRYRMLPRQ
ncbi:MAG: hypothetical protein KDK23_02670 [Leptospiraceae bacterium]|nr:hypothetical protein [Leptospiraceae bacterium]